MIKNASEFYSFCQENLTLKNKQSSIVEKRQFILVESDKLSVLRNGIMDVPFKTIPGTPKYP